MEGGVYNHIPILLVIIPLISAYLIPVLGHFYKKHTYTLSVLTSLFVFLSSILLAFIIVEKGPISYYTVGVEPPLAVEVFADHLTALMAILSSGLTFFTIFYSKSFIRNKIPDKRKVTYYSLIHLLLGSLMWIIIGADIFNIFVGIEILSISSYTLIAISHERDAILSAFNYLLLGSIGSALFLLGIGYLYVMTGTLNLTDIATRIIELEIGNSVPILTSLGLIVTGLSVKSAIFPLHFWMPDAYSKALSPICALSSGAIVNAMLYVLIRILLTVYGIEYISHTVPLTTLFLWISGIAMIIGSLYAVFQSDVKRMLAYSSVSQIGYVLLGFGVGTHLGFSAGFLHLFNHAIAKAALFFAVGIVVYKTGITNVRDFDKMGSRMPITMSLFSISAIAMVGLPPTNSFFSKFLLAYASADSGLWIFVFVIVISTLLTAAYFFRLIALSFFSSTNKNVEKKKEPISLIIPTAILTIACLVFGIGFSIPLSLLEPVAGLLL